MRVQFSVYKILLAMFSTVLIAHAAPVHDIGDFTAFPPGTSQDKAPLVMFTVSKDHQLWREAYNNYTNLDQDPDIDANYKSTITYYGYFNSFRCYNYDNSKGRWVPGDEASAKNKYCDGSSDGRWSGNFLNWATMTRMDVLRKLMYGGKRHVDVDGDTTLERAYLPTDAHSFAKYYNGHDALGNPEIHKVTPFTASEIFLPGATKPAIVTGEFEKYIGLTICNTTLPETFGKSHDTKKPPIMRIAQGNYSLWASSERWECLFDEEFHNKEIGSGANKTKYGANGNDFKKTGLPAFNFVPRRNVTAGEETLRDGIPIKNTTNDYDYTMHVQVCDPTDLKMSRKDYAKAEEFLLDESLTGAERLADDNLYLFNCTEYPNGNVKPKGILQEYGEDGLIKFGMVTGSYQKNNSGGVLRKRLGDLKDEIDVNTGRFYRRANVTPAGEKALSDNGSIIDTLDRLRIFGYNYGQFTSPPVEDHAGSYTTHFGDNCDYGLIDEKTNGICTSWGNPLAEMYLETLRYIAGQSPNFYANDQKHTSNTGGSDKEWTEGPATVSWSDPITKEFQCSPIKAITINAGAISHDADDLHGFSDLRSVTNTNRSLNDWTNAIGGKDFEDLNNKDSFFGGIAGSSKDINCSIKNTGTELGHVRGICPFGPTKNGSYHIAGLSYFGHTHDISEQEGKQTVDFFGVDFGGDLPVVDIETPDGSAKVKLIPAYKYSEINNINENSPNTKGKVGAGSLVDFRIISQNVPDPTDSDYTTGSFYVSWEDSEQGGDFDVDIWGVIRYRISNDKFEVHTDLMMNGTDKGYHAFGYVLSGTNDDGFHSHSGAGPKDDDPAKLYDCPASGCKIDTDNFVNMSTGFKSYDIIDKSDVVTLRSPLFYAAKWGGFLDRNGNGKIDIAYDSSGNAIADRSDWDPKFDEEDADVGDCRNTKLTPTYFSIRNPGELEKALDCFIGKIKEGTYSGNSASLGISTARSGSLLIHSFYRTYQSSQDVNDDSRVAWPGYIFSVWIDDQGRLREDSDGDGKLDEPSTDKVIEITSVEGQLYIRRSSDGEKFGELVDISNLKAVWDVADALAIYDDASLAKNRTYTDNASSGRYLFTAAAGVNTKVFTNDDVEPLEESLVDDFGYHYLGAENDTHAKNVVKFTRGINVSTMRNRKTKKLSNEYTHRLGDIIHSTPIVVGAPASKYDLLFGDRTYKDFRDEHINRRNMIYVGSNDGILHGINGGFLNKANKSFDKKPPEVTGSTSSKTYTQHELGHEIWGYVPANAVPHIKWPAQSDYQAHHVYITDGPILAADVRVFGNDKENGHVNGWGTVLVSGMGMGGAPYTVDTKGEGKKSDERTFRSSYTIMDITDPESPPRLMAEIALDDLGLTIAEPAIARVGSDWYLLLASGPIGAETENYSVLNELTSNQKARLFVIDLSEPTSVREVFEIDEQDTYIGGIVVGDMDLDARAESIYFGTVKTTNKTELGGALYKVNTYENGSAFSWDQPARMTSTEAPHSYVPTIALGENKERWIFSGTGRLRVDNDFVSTHHNFVVGLKDSGSYPLTDVVDVTNVKVKDDPTNAYMVSGIKDESNMTYESFKSLVGNKNGWIRYLREASGNNAAEAAVGSAPLFGKVLFQQIYQPESNICAVTGATRLLGMCYYTGTACPEIEIFPEPEGATNLVDEIDIESKGSVGGVIVFPYPGAGEGGDGESCASRNDIKLLSKGASGEIVSTNACVADPIRSGEISWREIIE